MYAALSYCWGEGSTQLRTTTANYGTMLNDIELTSLPAVVIDAIKFCQNLGIFYLWVDALCIIQDDSDNWDRESAKMASIYGRSTITLSAAMSSCSEQGFIDISAEMRQVQLTWWDPSIKRRGEIYLQPLHSGFSTLYQDSPLMRRGWVLQEHHLSPRVLHFGQQMYWECWEAMFSEDGRFNRALNRLASDANPNVFTLGRTPMANQCERISHHNIEDRWTTFEYWSQMVENFSKRRFSYPMDKLPALIGLAETGRGKTNDTYHAGLWRSSLDLDLLWRRKESTYMTQPPQYRAPSWSWASLEGPIIPWSRVVFATTNSITHDIRVETDFIDVSTPQSAAGRIRDDSFIVAVGPVKEARFPHQGEAFDTDDMTVTEWIQDGFTCEFLATTGSPLTYYWTCVFDQQADKTSRKIHLLRINVDIAVNTSNILLGLKYWSLILEEAAGSFIGTGERRFKRIGLAWLYVNPRYLGDFQNGRGLSLPEISWTSHSAKDWTREKIRIL